jgi:hypothetical protein
VHRLPREVLRKETVTAPPQNSILSFAPFLPSLIFVFHYFCLFYAYFFVLTSFCISFSFVYVNRFILPMYLLDTTEVS